MNKKKQLLSSVEEEEKTRKPKSSEEDDDEIEGVEVQKRDKKGAKKQPEGLESGKEFNNSIFRLLKAQHPNVGISNKAMKMCNDIVIFQFHQLLGESKFLTDMNKKQTLGYKEMEAAVKLTLPSGTSFRDVCVKAGREAIEAYSLTERQG